VRSFPGAHFAVFPADLVRPCILAGCPKNGTVLDCFAGSGTVGDVATELGRDAILVELNPVYVQMQKGRSAIGGVLGEHEPKATDEGPKDPGWLF
jgi:DNA modification methylase